MAISEDEWDCDWCCEGVPETQVHFAVYEREHIPLCKKCYKDLLNDDNYRKFFYCGVCDKSWEGKHTTCPSCHNEMIYVYISETEECVKKSQVG